MLRGVREQAELPARRSEPFPYARDELHAAARGRLPRQFDWRSKGAVTHVRSQYPTRATHPAPPTAPSPRCLYDRVRCRPGLVQLVLGFRGGGRGGGRAVRAHALARAAQRAVPRRLRAPVRIYRSMTQAARRWGTCRCNVCVVCAGTAGTGAAARGRAPPTATSRIAGCRRSRSTRPTRRRYARPEGSSYEVDGDIYS